MKKNICFIILAALSLTAFSQKSDYIGNSGMQILTKGNSEVDKVEGSPYFEGQFIPGILLDQEGRTQHAYFRYNASQDQIEIKIDPNQEETYILPRYPRYSYKLKDYTYILDKLKTAEGKQLEGYFMQYYKDGKSRLLGKPDISITPRQEAKTGYDKATPAQLDIDQIYYLQLGDGALREVRLKERDFKELLENKPGMKTYFKEHKVKDMNDVVALLRFYGQQ